MQIRAAMNPEEVTLKGGRVASIRPLVKDDEVALGDFLESLGPETRRRFEPHPLTRSAAHNICDALEFTLRIPVVAVLDGRIVGYAILDLGFPDDDHDERPRYAALGIDLNPTQDCRLAPAIADDMQGQGLGFLLCEYLVRMARGLGRRHLILWGGTQASNTAAIGLYRKLGFRDYGEAFTDLNGANLDMMLEL